MNLGGAWPVRVLWLTLPLTLGPALESALSDRSGPVAVVAAVLAWLAWTAGAVATFVPRTVGLTALRVTAPVTVLAAGWAATADGVGTTAAVAGLVAAALAVVVAFSPTTGDAFVNGSAYGPERRFALRVPGPLVLGPVPLLWAVAVGGTLTGPLLLAARQWAPGAVALVVGAPLAVLAVRSLHQLARRWLVFVPAGVVVHDPAAVGPQLLRRQTIRSFGPAPADTAAHDLTAGALGLALRIELVAPVTLELRRARGAPPPPVETSELLVAPTRPGAVLREAASRRLPVATPA
ncbi:hypothetical protein [Actinomarinicola tropica]|uniref:Uncharacterized protein n=1 Tax=Actinomarinicola tropica TaxID=2789776 RepID=A0A5Q2RJQ6_9ACTN|nr:hypothetical protein [Actinomarinicola tropica]QGG94626.1 hypothetical protein GH723_05610 [Actinomarinicola tropica]